MVATRSHYVPASKVSHLLTAMTLYISALNLDLYEFTVCHLLDMFCKEFLQAYTLYRWYGPQILRHLKHSDTIQYTFYGFKRLGG